MKFKKEVYLIGGGPSLKGIDLNLLKDKTTIVTNKAIFDVPNPDMFITVDNSFFLKIKEKMKKFTSINAWKVFVVDLSYDYIRDEDGAFYDTRAKHHNPYKTSHVDTIIKAHKKEGIGFTWNDFRTGVNSGFCALQLAVLLGYEKIHLLGYDLCTTTRTHYHDGYPECKVDPFNILLTKYQEYFSKALPEILLRGIKVVSHSPISFLNEILLYEELK